MLVYLKSEMVPECGWETTDLGHSIYRGNFAIANYIPWQC